MIAMRNLLPQDGLSTHFWMLKSHLDFLRNRSKVQQLAQLFYPVIRAFAGTAGEAVSMPVDLEYAQMNTTELTYFKDGLALSLSLSLCFSYLVSCGGNIYAPLP